MFFFSCYLIEITVGIIASCPSTVHLQKDASFIFSIQQMTKYLPLCFWGFFLSLNKTISLCLSWYTKCFSLQSGPPSCLLDSLSYIKAFILLRNPYLGPAQAQLQTRPHQCWEERKSPPSASLSALFLIQPRNLLAFFYERTLSWLILNLLSIKNPRCFLKGAFYAVDSSLLFCPRCKTLHLLFLTFVDFVFIWSFLSPGAQPTRSIFTVHVTGSQSSAKRDTSSTVVLLWLNNSLKVYLWEERFWHCKAKAGISEI